MVRRSTFDSAALERGCQRRLPADRRAQCGRPWDRIRTRSDGAYRWPMRRFRTPHLERAVSHDLGCIDLACGSADSWATSSTAGRNCCARRNSCTATRLDWASCCWWCSPAWRWGMWATRTDWSSPGGKRGWRGWAGVTSGFRRSRLGPGCTRSRDPGSPDESLGVAEPMSWWGSPRHANSIRRKRLFERELGLDGLACAAGMISADPSRQTRQPWKRCSITGF